MTKHEAVHAENSWMLYCAITEVSEATVGMTLVCLLALAWHHCAYVWRGYSARPGTMHGRAWAHG
jgi:hypothetical protein